jgi:two-component system nitrate/nitrite sensor histidine kinase NarX
MDLLSLVQAPEAIEPGSTAPAAAEPSPTPAARSAAEGEFAAPLQQLLDTIVVLSGARAATVRLLDDRRALQLVGAARVPAVFEQRLAGVDAGCGICAQVIERNAVGDSALICPCVHSLAEAGTPTRLVRVLPLRHRGEPCGVLTLFVPANARPRADVSALLPALGEVLGLALENARRSQSSLHASLMQERHFLASEVHDSLAQNLTSVRMRIALMRDAISKLDTVRAFSYLSEIDESMSTAQSRVRELITHFRTRMDPNGLVSALRKTVEELQGITGMEIEFDSAIAQLPMSADEELQVFHIVREALVNVIKHSQARHARVTIEPTDRGCRIEVEDDGVGLAADCDGAPGHFGLNIMRERARTIGGEIELDSRIGHGTRLRLHFPLVGAGPRSALGATA